MQIAVSFLGIEKDLVKNLQLLNKTDVDYFHYDIMDGKFVENKTGLFKQDLAISKTLKKSFDVHLMVDDVKKYVDQYMLLKPEWITFHLEIGDTDNLIKYIKDKKIDVGISIKPNTAIDKLLPFLAKVDVVLIMSVEPGAGGQRFLKKAIDRINYLYKYRQEHNLKYIIQVDGGINDKTIKMVRTADVVVVGSFITNSNDYQKKLDLLRERK